MGILKAEFPPVQDWFSKFKVLFDLGFVGVDKLYEFKELILGEKKPRKSKSNPKPELSAAQKSKNRSVSKERIFVEHAIGKMKRYRILKNRCRLKCPKLKNMILGIAAALWNYQIDLNCSL
ncbi:MAG: transposase family protein, partial [Bacteroidota bacterium]